ncbi:MAG: histidinol dehydrogenase, partial [Candidatus Nanopelagicales bacterium]
MIRLIDLRGTTVDPRTTLPRAVMDVADATEHIRPILNDVRDQGAAAVAAWSARLDGITPPSLRVPLERLTQAEAELDPQVRAALLEAIRR